MVGDDISEYQMLEQGARNGPTVCRRDVLKGGAVVGLGVLGATGVAPVAASSEDTHRFLFQNTWLLNGLFGNDTDIAKPALDERAQEFGDRLRESDIDIAALCEVFASTQREQIRAPIDRTVDWEIGPPADAEKSSGLYTLGIGGHSITEYERYEFEHDGHEPRDADAWANKGLLFTRIEVASGKLDLFTTHLLAGGGLPYVDLDPFGEPPTPGEYRADQLRELESFVRSTKQRYDPDREVPTIVAGDFNISPTDSQYELLTAVRDRLGLYDAWERFGNGRGPTGRNAVTHCQFDPDDGPPYYCSGGEGDSGRIDYVLLDTADRLQVKGLRRRVFWRELAPSDQFFVDGDTENPNYLTDHVGLELDFTVA